MKNLDEIVTGISEVIQFMINHEENQPKTEFCANVDKLINLKSDLVSGDEQSSSNCNIPLVTNRTCSNCHHCVVNPSSENEHDQYKCFAKEHITTISNINNYVCDKWTENSF